MRLLIALVDLWRSGAEIVQAIVARISIDVIDALGPPAMHHDPNDAMRREIAIKHLDLDVPSSVSARDCAGVLRIPD